nr:hypothetical protein [uncultured Sphingomonas sp.]
MTLDRRALVEEAMLAPSVHNVQPARWRLIGDDGLLLLEDRSVRLGVGDPHGHDAAISLGAAAEGLRLAAARQGAALVPLGDLPGAVGPLSPVATFRLDLGKGQADPLAEFVEARRSWRGTFAAPTDKDRQAAEALAAGDTSIITDLTTLPALADQASFHFMRDREFRRELLSWMRLSRRHPRWHKDGLSADAMAMGRFEAIGAGLVLGPLFGLLDRLHLAAPLLSEEGKTQGSAGLVVFHRPADEPPFVSGAHFYRCWLRIEAAGFGAAVVAALADHRPSAEKVAQLAGLPPGRRVVSTFRIGRRPGGANCSRSRQALDDVIV